MPPSPAGGSWRAMLPVGPRNWANSISMIVLDDSAKAQFRGWFTGCFVLSTSVVPVSWRSRNSRSKALSVARDTVAPRSVTRGPPMREVLASPKMLAIMILAGASGYPNQLTESALQAWLKDSQVSNTVIGLMSYVAMPYLLKFLWAPLI